MDQLQGMRVFVRVAQHAGFAAAARDLRMSTAAVSKHVSALESRVGTRLFDRTTRRVSLTEAGRVYLERCIECLQAVEDADASVSELAKAPKGVLRVTAPIDFADPLMPVLAQLMRAHADLVVDLVLSDRVLDMVEQRIDVGVRVAPALQGGYVARTVALTRIAIVGSPEYFREHGRPKKPADLEQHEFVVFNEPKPRLEIELARGRRKARVSVRPALTSNAGGALSSAMRAGLGIGVAPSFLVQRELEAGTLEPVLTDWSVPPLKVFAVYPHRRFLSPKVRVFVEALRAAFGDGDRDPWWPSSLEG